MIAVLEGRFRALTVEPAHFLHKLKIKRNKNGFFPALLPLFLWVILLLPAPSAEAQSNFYLADNGITVMCPDAQIGDTGVVNEIEYTKRSRDQITTNNAPTTCTSGITDMSHIFLNASSFNGDISSWDVSNVTDMVRMFDGASSFNGDISSWDVSNVTVMLDMFDGANSFNGDISGWDVSSVTEMSNLFRGGSCVQSGSERLGCVKRHIHGGNVQWCQFL